MQKQAFYKQLHVWSGKVLTTLHIGQHSVSLPGRAETWTTTQQIHKRWLPPFPPYHGGFCLKRKVTAFSNHIISVKEQKLKQADDRNVGPARRGCMSKGVWVIKYEWEFTCKQWACVMFSDSHREREREKRFLTHTQVQTSPASLCNWCTNGSGWHWTDGGRVQTGTSKACWTLNNKCALIRHRRTEQMKGVLMHLHLHPPQSISSRPEEPGHQRRMHRIETNTQIKTHRQLGSMSSQWVGKRTHH